MKKILAGCLFISLFSVNAFCQLRTPLLVKDEKGLTTLDWAVLKQIILSFPNLAPLAGTDSVDYIGQVYYRTPNEAKGFERTALKRSKNKNRWQYEAFYKIVTTDNDTVKVQNEFISLYRAFKNTISANTGNDFIAAAIAKDSLLKKDLNWLALWTLYTNYKVLPAGLPKIRIGLMLNGQNDFMDKTKRIYTIKVYVADDEVNFDFFTWDKPR